MCVDSHLVTAAMTSSIKVKLYFSMGALVKHCVIKKTRKSKHASTKDCVTNSEAFSKADHRLAKCPARQKSGRDYCASHR